MLNSSYILHTSILENASGSKMVHTLFPSLFRLLSGLLAPTLVFLQSILTEAARIIPYNVNQIRLLLYLKTAPQWIPIASSPTFKSLLKGLHNNEGYPDNMSKIVTHHHHLPPPALVIPIFHSFNPSLISHIIYLIYLLFFCLSSLKYKFCMGMILSVSFTDVC